MGHRTESKQLLLLGKKNNKYIWNSKYIEKNNFESTVYLFQSIEIEKFLKSFLSNYNLELYKYNIHFSESTRKIFVSYLKTSKIKNYISKLNSNQKIKLLNKRNNFKKSLFKKNLLQNLQKQNQRCRINHKINVFINYESLYYKYFRPLIFFKSLLKQQYSFFFNKAKFKFNIEKQTVLTKLNYIIFCLSHKYLTNNQFYKLKLVNTVYLNKQTIQNFLNYLKVQKLLSLTYKSLLIKLFLFSLLNKNVFKLLFLHEPRLKKQRLEILQDYKNYVKLNSNLTIQHLKQNNFLQTFNKSVNIFTKNKFPNTFIFQQINKNILFNLTYRQLQSLKKVIIQLRQFNNSSFFKEGLNVILLSLLNPQEINVLANFIALQLKLSKRHGFFFKFLSKSLSLLLRNKFSKIKSIKILVKGRLNGKLRANKKVLFINKYMSLMTINSSINFTYSNSYSSNGVIGIKLWVNTY